MEKFHTEVGEKISDGTFKTFRCMYLFLSFYLSIYLSIYFLYRIKKTDTSHILEKNLHRKFTQVPERFPS
jgi:hypothetical protein